MKIISQNQLFRTKTYVIAAVTTSDNITTIMNTALNMVVPDSKFMPKKLAINVGNISTTEIVVRRFMTTFKLLEINEA